MLKKMFHKLSEDPLKGVSTLDKTLFALILAIALINCTIIGLCGSSVIEIIKLY